VARPERDAAGIVAALELVFEHAREELALLEQQPVRSPRSDEVARSVRGPLPEEGEGALAAVQTLIGVSREAQVRSTGPRFFHWVMGGVTPAALAADWLASLIDQNAGGYDASPLATELERVSISWLLDLFGLPSSWGGVFVTGGTMANYSGLAAARRWWALQHGVDLEQDGFAGLPELPVFSSGFIHVTALKSLAMLGLGRDRTTICAADATGRLDLRLLEAKLQELNGAPAILIANAGEVNAGQFDPIAAIADLADRYGAWLHVDGAFGLFAALSPKTRMLVDGVDRAHSVSSDGHKWLNVPFDCGFVFVRDSEFLTGAFTAGADYLPVADEERPVYGFMAPELSRRARAITVWTTLRAYGRSGYREIVEQSLENAARVVALVEHAPDLELLAPAPLNVVCFRYRPRSIPEEQLDALNLAIAERILTDGRVYVGTSRWAGKTGFRPAFVNWRTTPGDAELLIEVIRDLGEQIIRRETA
jgi:glutamate/tyrosine decarboxylase-like PLP-dependent enzyme